MKKIRLGLFPNLDKKAVLAYLPQVIAMCRTLELEVVLPEAIADNYAVQAYDIQDSASLQELDVAMSLGGDGTFLRMAHYVAALMVPVIGVNMGKLGFLTEVEWPYLQQALERIKGGNYTIGKHSMLKADVYRGKNVIISTQALNDIVLARGHFSKITRLSVKIEGKPSANYPSDGLIVATATGSTAYSLSAGGPIIYPGLDVIALTPICAHALHTRPLIIPMTEKIEIQPRTPSEEILLSSDGEIVQAIDSDEKVVITKGPHTVNFIKMNPASYYETWQDKLLRGENSTQF